MLWLGGRHFIIRSLSTSILTPKLPKHQYLRWVCRTTGSLPTSERSLPHTFLASPQASLPLHPHPITVQSGIFFLSAPLLPPLWGNFLTLSPSPPQADFEALPSICAALGKGLQNHSAPLLSSISFAIFEGGPGTAGTS